MIPIPAIAGSKVPFTTSVIPVPLKVPPLGFAVILEGTPITQNGPVFPKVILPLPVTLTKVLSTFVQPVASVMVTKYIPSSDAIALESIGF